MAKPLTLLTHQQTKFEWAPTHHTAFLTPKESVIQAPILCYLDPMKCYIVYTDASDDTCRVQLSQEHDGMEFTIDIPSWLSKGNGSPQNKRLMVCIMQSQNGTITSKELMLLPVMTKNHWHNFLMEINANNKVNRWRLELATYHITFKWILGAQNKAAHSL